MAQSNKVEVQIVAVDEASPKIDKLTKKIDGLESDEARIIVTSNIERIDQQLSDALYTLHQLDGDEATVQARLVGGLEDDLIAAKKLFDQLDGATGTVHLDTDDATTGVRDLGKTADSSKNALANMVGNTSQDMGELVGVTGSAGVAIGQMAEFAADAAFAGEGLSVALGNMLKVAGPIAGLALSVQLLKRAFEGTAEASDLAADNQEAWNKAIEEGGNIADNWVEQLQKTHKAMVDITDLPELSLDLRQADFDLERFFKFWQSGRVQVADVTDALEQAGITTSDVAKAASLGGDAYERFAEGVEQAAEAGRISNDQRILLIALLDQQTEALGKARVAQREFSKVFDPRKQASDLAAANRQLDDYIDFLEGRHWQVAAAGQAASNAQLEEYLRLIEGRHDEAVEEQKVADATDAHFDALARLNREAEAHDRITPLQREADAARATTTQYETMFATLNEEGARLQLAQDFADAREQLAKGTLTDAEIAKVVDDAKRAAEKAGKPLTDAEVAAVVAEAKARAAESQLTGLEKLQVLNRLKLEAAQFSDEFKIPPSITVEVLAEIATGKLTEAEKTVLGYIPPKPVVVPVVPKVVSAAAAAGATADQLERIAQSPMTAFQRSPSNVTIINPPGTPAATVDSLNKFLEFNGSR